MFRYLDIIIRDFLLCMLKLEIHKIEALIKVTVTKN